MGRMFKKLILSVVLTYASAIVAQTACSTLSLGPMGALNGFVPSAGDAWHQDISASPLDGLSRWIMTGAIDLGAGHLSVKFSSVAGGNYGIPYTVVDSQTTPGAAVPITLRPSESDITLVPIPSVLPVEESTGQCPLTGNDRRALILDRNQCVLYEIYQADHCTTNGWTGSNMAVWDLTIAEKRPYGYVSADAAGLSVFEGLVRYDEIVAGVINHAIRFTAVNTKNNAANGLFTAPATHAAGTTKNTDNIMGMRVRLRANFDISGFSTTNQIILTALKKYGMILADNGPNLSLEGTPDARWDDTDLAALSSVQSSDLEVVKMGPQYDSTTAPKGAAPVITSFTASATTIAAGGSVTLTPTVTGASYSYIDNAGFVRGPVTVSPAATTTYTLTSRNEFGSASASVTVTVGGTQTVPTLKFAAIPTQTFGAGPFAVSASSQSSGAITYSIASGPATIAGSSVTLSGIGTVVVKAAQAAAGTYGAATATTSFTVLAGNPGLAIVPIPDQAYTSTPLTVSATTSSTGSITYSVVSGPATISGNKATLTGTGTVKLQANQSAAGNYLAAVATTSFNVTAAGQTMPTLVFTGIGTQTLGVAPFTVQATSQSTGAVTYAVASGPATIAGNTVTLTGAGTVVLQASQAAAGIYSAATTTTSFLVQAGGVVGGKVATPTTTSAGFYVHVAQNGNAYFMNAGATTNPQAGIWFASASACEANPSTCTWTPLHTGEPSLNGSYINLREMVDIDSTHEIGIFSFNWLSGKCPECSIQILNTATGTYTPITLPNKRAGESPVCMARDSNGIFYTMLNYHAGIWKSTDNTAATWTQVSADYTTLPGLAGAAGNIYTCKVLGPRIYFGGETGVLSCNLSFSSCSQDYLPFGTGQRNFESVLADVDEGSANSPSMMLECCKQDTTVPGYVSYSRFSGGKWTQMTTSSGLTQYGQQQYFETFAQATGTGTARRYYVMLENSNPPNVAYKSTDSTGTTFAPFNPTQWPKSSATYSPWQMSPDPRNGAIWTVFIGNSGSDLYITP